MAKAAELPKSSAPALVTHHVFLDTQVYRSQAHNPDSPLLIALGDQIAADRLVLHITDITLAEVRRQLGDIVGDAAIAIKDARRQLAIWRKRLPHSVTGDFPSFDQAGVAEAAFKRFRTTAHADWRVVNHDATAVAASEVFQDYFRREPPFESVGSKEFPDAFVVRALEDWCTQAGERMYVIGADRAMAAAVNKSAVLLHIQSLADLLELLAATETPDVVAQAEALLCEPEISRALRGEIEAKIDDLVPVYVGGDLVDGEVSGHELNGEIEIEDFTVLATSHENIGVILKVRVPLKVSVSFEDRSSATYDKEDDIYFGAESAKTSIEDEPIIKIFGKLIRDPLGVTGVQFMTIEFEVDDTYDDYR